MLIGVLRAGVHDPADERLLPYLSAYAKQASAAGNVPVLDTSNWRDHARAHANTPVAMKLEKLLTAFRTRSSHLGAVIKIVPVDDAPLADAANSEELLVFLGELRRRGDIEWPLAAEPGSANQQVETTREPVTRGRITVQGWGRVEAPLHAGGEPYMAKQLDAFICHAGEDKTAAALPLAERLRAMGYEVWYDNFMIKMGDSLRRKIDEGLVRSRFGVVILSRAFFAKEWPQKELDGLVAREIAGVKVILPVWHGIDAAGVVAKSPTLADRVAARMEEGLDEVVRKIVEVLGPPRGRASRRRDPPDPRRSLRCAIESGSK